MSKMNYEKAIIINQFFNAMQKSEGKLESSIQDIKVNPAQYGLFLKHYGMGGHYALPPPPLVTLLFLTVEEQNLVASAILMCFL